MESDSHATRARPTKPALRGSRFVEQTGVWIQQVMAQRSGLALQHFLTPARLSNSKN